MKVTFWGTRGSLASPGMETARYGGNTSCVEIRAENGTLLILDAGTGIRRLGAGLPLSLRRVDVLLTHLHMDHIQGLGFFAPLYQPDIEVHIWGPASTTLGLRTRLTRYLSPPFFPVHLRDLPCRLVLHEVPAGDVTIGPFAVSSDLVCHPGPTVGYRIAAAGSVVTYLPDHEPALGVPQFPLSPDWTSGHALASGADLLIHDAQYGAEQYSAHVGWGHSSMEQALQFAMLARVRHAAPFHHDPAHDDAAIERLLAYATAAVRPTCRVTPAVEGMTFDVRAERTDLQMAQAAEQ